MPGREPWHELERELERWAAEDRTARFWLRDDDAVEPTAALDRLLQLTDEHRVPALLAVIPLGAKSCLARRLRGVPDVSPCQHGCAHLNHAAADQKKEELGTHRPLAVVLEDIRVARDRLAALFDGAVAPMLVPPWNRIAPRVATELPSLGFDALSTFGPPSSAVPILQLNCDIDLVDWKGGRRAHDTATLVAALVAALSGARRDHGRPVGVLAHHLVHDDAAWSFLREMFVRTAARWISIAALLAS